MLRTVHACDVIGRQRESGAEESADGDCESGRRDEVHGVDSKVCWG